MFKGNVTACVGAPYAGDLGRKGTESDVTLYNNKVGDTVLSFAQPSSYPDKIQSLLTCLMMSQQVLFKVEEISKEFAETLVALECAHAEKGYLLTELDVGPLIKDTVVEGYEILPAQVVEVRGTLAQLGPDPSAAAIVQVDHCFAVKGVGTVALGVVKEGTVKKYCQLCSTNGDPVQVKSIQVHDTDVAEAAAGVRVGLALKNAKPDEIPRGTILSEEETSMFNEIRGKLSLSPHSPVAVSPGDSVMVASALNYRPAKILEGSVKKGESRDVVLELEKPMPLSGPVFVLDAGQESPRVFGSISFS